ncbi:MAG: folate-binding protein [Rhodanobacter sp.]
MPTYHSAQRLQIEGPDAVAFAHAQFSSNVKALGTGQWQFSAWLDPQGRVRALFHLVRLADDHLLLLLRGGDAKALSDALSHFVFREKLSLRVATSILALSTGRPLPLYSANDSDSETLTLGCGSHSLQICNDHDGDDQWCIEQLYLGWPWLPEQASGKWLAPALSLHRLHAVVTDKGCYPGQEIIARLHFRGGNKRHLCRVTLSHKSQPADVLRLNQREIGYVLNTVYSAEGTEALVVLSDDVATQASDGHSLALDDKQTLRLVTAWEA